MSEFWAVAGFLTIAIATVALALAFVLPFLMRGRAKAVGRAARREVNLEVYRDQMKDLKAELSEAQVSQEQFLANKLELETRAAEDALAPEDASPVPVASGRLGFALAALLPVAAFGMYFWLGNPSVLTAVASGQGAAPVAATPSTDDILRMVEQIETRTQTHPTDSAAWEALAMANTLVNRWPQAVQAYQEANRLVPDKPSILVGYAESLAMSNNQVLEGRPIELITKALQLEPNNAKGLNLAGIHAYQTQNFAKAVEFLDRLGSQLTPGTPEAREVLAMRNEAQQRMVAGAGGGGPAGNGTAAATTPPPAAVSPATTAGIGARVAGRVDVAEALRSRIGKQDTLFVLARAGESGPPLAAVRLPMGPLPLRFDLNDSMAMIPGNELSKHKEVTLVARISASGNPIAQPGDLEGRMARVVVGSDQVSLVIDRVVP